MKSLSTKQLSYLHPYSNPFPDVEWMPIHTRACVGTVIGYIYSVGQFILAGVAYAVPHWRHLQLLVSVPYFVAFIYSWYVGPGVGSNGPEPYRATRDRPSLRGWAQTSPETLPKTESSPTPVLLLNRLKPRLWGVGFVLEEGGSSLEPHSLTCLLTLPFPTQHPRAKF